MNAEIEISQTKKLSSDLVDMSERYSESLSKAKEVWPTLVPLRVLTLLEEISNATTDLDHLADVAIEQLPDNTDSDPAEAVLKGAIALNLKQANQIYELIGLTLRYMQEHTPPAHGNETLIAAGGTPQGAGSATH